MNNLINRRLLTVNEVCKTLNITRTTLWRLRKDGRIKESVLSKSRFPQEEVEKLLKSKD